MTIEKPVSSVSADTFIQSLRKQTADLHTELEALPLSAQLTHKQLSLPHYISYLQKMYAVNLFVEENIFPLVQNVLKDLPERRKLQWLTNDLEYLGTQINVLPYFTIQAETPADTAFALGVLYVMEGSTLGGRVILKNVETALHLTPLAGACYFAGYQANTGKLWKHFLNTLEDYRLHNNCGQHIITGAVTAFSSIISYMKK